MAELYVVGAELLRCTIEGKPVSKGRPGRPDEPCDAEIWSWDLFTPRQVDAYWIGCDRVGPHDEHHDNHTGAVWSDDRSATVPERTNR